MAACRLLPVFSRLSFLPSTRNFHSSVWLCAEPLKKKKKMDPAVVRAREERKKKKLERSIRKLEKNTRLLKPLEELEVPLPLVDEASRRQRVVSVPESEIHCRALLQKEWAHWKQQRNAQDLQSLTKAVMSQQRALKELRAESEDLYWEAVQIDPTFIPFRAVGPVATPAIKNYNVPDGDYVDVSKKWD